MGTHMTIPLWDNKNILIYISVNDSAREKE